MTRLLAITAAFAGSLALVHAEGWQESAGSYFSRERAPVSHYGQVPKYLTRNNHIPIILAEARRQGVPERLALKVCKIESNCNLYATGPRTKHGHHYGAYQIRPSSARRFGYAGGTLQGLPGLRYGMAHLADCYKRAGGQEHLAARCHVAGPASINGKMRLAGWAERYAQRYTRQVINAQPPLWAGKLQVAWRQ